MSKIQQLINVAGEADTLSQALEEFFRDYFQNFKEDERDENAESLLEQVHALGQNARRIDCESLVLWTAPFYPVGTRILHTASGREYRITQDPSMGLRIEATNEPAYEYMSPLGSDDELTKWARAQSEMEDGRFVRIVEDVPTGAKDKFPIQVESRRQEGNGWVESGMYHNAMFDGHQPFGIKGCPCGRSQVSAEAAIRDLVTRTNGESGTSLTVDRLEVSRYTVGRAYWKPEKIGPHDGWKCQTCGTCITVGTPFNCECPNPYPPPKIMPDPSDAAPTANDVAELAVAGLKAMAEMTHARDMVHDRLWQLVEACTAVPGHFPKAVLIGHVDTDVATLRIHGRGPGPELEILTGADGRYNVYGDNYDAYGVPGRIIIDLGRGVTEGAPDE